MNNNNNYCEFEQTIINSHKDDCLNAEQKLHINNCSICSNSLTVFTWMNQFENIGKRDNEVEKILPTPENIWKRAFTPISSKKELISKAMRPLVITQLITYLTIFSGVVFVLFGKISIFKTLFGNFFKDSEFINSFTTLFASLSKTLPFLIVPLGMVALLLVSYFIYSLFNPESA